MQSRIIWPEGKQFAFTVFDDTDRATLENVGDVYALLENLGFRTTKSVWPLEPKIKQSCVGSSCNDPNYVSWLRKLQAAGFEIGYHMAAPQSSTRDETIKGLDRFRELFGQDPAAMANHVGCMEDVYWDRNRVSGVNRYVYELFTRNRGNRKYQGHVEGSEYFWGDICRQRIRYVRNFVFPEINTLRMCPMMPYHDLERPFVKSWFASSDGAGVTKFKRCLSERNQDRLEAEGGACIMYAHFSFGFFKDNRIDAEFESLMERLSRKNGWFVPVSTLLDYLAQRNHNHVINSWERSRLERKWLVRKAFMGTD